MRLFQEIKHKLLILGCLFAGAIIADAKDVTIDFSAQGYVNAQDMPKSIVMDEYITLQFGYGVIHTKYYTAGSAVRIYGKGSVTINTSDMEKPITQIVYTFAKPDAPTSSNASFSGGGTITYEEASTTWTGSSNSVTLTRASGNGHWKLQRVVVTYTDSSTPVEPSFVTVDGIAGLQALESGTKTRLHWTDGMNARVLYSNEELTFVRDESADDGSYSALCLRGVNAVANNPLHSNQHLSGWVIGKYKVESGMPVFECTEETNTDSLVIAEPVTEADVKIKGRGNSTWAMAKKPYALKFDEKISLLDEPKDKSWVLLANYADKTSLRNQTAFYMGSISNLDYTPRFHFVDLMLNGRYNGTYQLGEKIKISKDRVNVGDDGFLLEIDAKAGADEITFYTNHLNHPVNIKDPDVEVDDENYNYIKDYVITAEDALFSC